MGKGSTSTTVDQSGPPAAVLAQYQNVQNQANNVAGNPYQYYQGQLVAGLSPGQTGAIGDISDLAAAMENPANTYGMAQPFINSASGMTTAAANTMGGLYGDLSALENPWNTYGQAQPYLNAAGQLISAGSSPITAGDINQYMNPFLQQVGQTTSAEINQNNAIQQQQLEGGAAASGALGGNRLGLAQSALANQQDLAENATLANINAQGFNTALGAAQTTAGQQLQGGFLMGQTGQTAENAALSGLEAPFSGASTIANTLLGTGSQMGNLGSLNESAATGALNTGLTGAGAQLSASGQLQTQQQNELNAAYQQWLGALEYPYQNTNFLAGVQSGLGSLEGGTSSTSTPGPSTTSQLLGAGIGTVGLLGALGVLKRGGRVEKAVGGGGGLGNGLASTAENSIVVPYESNNAIQGQDEVGNNTPAGYMSAVNMQPIAHGNGPPQAPQGQQQAQQQIAGFSSIPDAMQFIGQSVQEGQNSGPTLLGTMLNSPTLYFANQPGWGPGLGAEEYKKGGAPESLSDGVPWTNERYMPAGFTSHQALLPEVDHALGLPYIGLHPTLVADRPRTPQHYRTEIHNQEMEKERQLAAEKGEHPTNPGGFYERQHFDDGGEVPTPLSEQILDYQMMSQLAPGSEVRKTQYQAPQGVYAEGGPVGPTTPEPAGDIAAQLRALTDPHSSKQSVFVARGTPLDSLPPGVRAVTRPEGTLVTSNPQHVHDFIIAPHLSNDLMARLLDYPQSKDEVAKHPDQRVVRAHDGHHVTYEAATTPEGVQRALDIAARHSPGSHRDVTTPEGAVNDRYERVHKDGGGTIGAQGMQGVSGMSLIDPSQPVPATGNINYGGTNAPGTWSGVQLPATPQAHNLAVPRGNATGFSAPQAGNINLSLGSSSPSFAPLTGAGSGSPIDPQTGVPDNYFQSMMQTDPYLIQGTSASSITPQQAQASYDAIHGINPNPTPAPSNNFQQLWDEVNGLPSHRGESYAGDSEGGGTPQEARGGRIHKDDGGSATMPWMPPSGDQAPVPAVPVANPTIPWLPAGLTGASAAPQVNPVQAQPLAPVPGVPQQQAPAPQAAPMPPPTPGFNAPPAPPPVPRGLRDNNPLNLDYAQGQTGLDPNQPADGAEGRYVSVTDGLANSTKQLLDYQGRGINTVSGLVNMWKTGNPAGVQGNDTSTAIASVSRALNVAPNQPIDLSNPETLATFEQALWPTETPGGVDAQAIQAGVTLGMQGGPRGAQYAQNDNDQTDAGFSSGPGQFMSPFYAPPQAVQAANTANQPVQNPAVPETTRNEQIMESPWMALAQAGFGMMAGTSKFPGVNIGQGLESGINYENNILQQQRARQSMQYNAGNQNVQNTLAQREQGIQGGNVMNTATGNAVGGFNAYPGYQGAQGAAAVGGPGMTRPPPMWPGEQPPANAGGYGGGQGAGQNSAPSYDPETATGLTGAAPATTQMVPGPYGGMVPFNVAYQEALQGQISPTTSRAATQWLNTYGAQSVQSEINDLSKQNDTASQQIATVDEIVRASKAFLTGAGSEARLDLLKGVETLANGLQTDLTPGLEQATEAGQLIPKLSTFLQSSIAKYASDTGGEGVLQLVGPAIPGMANTRAGLVLLGRTYNVLATRAMAQAQYVTNAVQNGQYGYNYAMDDFNARNPPDMWASYVQPRDMPADASQLQPGYAYQDKSGMAFMWTGQGWAPVPGSGAPQ